MRRCRLAVLASHPIQYFTPIYKLLAKHPGIDLEVMFYRDFGVRTSYDEQFGRAIAWDTDQLSGFESRFLANLSPITNTFSPFHAINPGAFARLLHGFDAVWLNGYMYPSNWFAAASAELVRTAILFRSELRLASDRAPRWSDWIRERVIRGWVRRSDALLYIGEANRRAYLHYGADESKLFFTPYSADLPAIRAARMHTAADPKAARNRWGVPHDKIVLLFVGKLIPRKHPEAAISIAADRELRDRVHLVIAGSGPLEESLQQQVKSNDLDNVTFLGFVNQSRLPDVYAIADLFLMPSEQEPWGIVLNEAMAAGLVPIVSDAVGATDDLVHSAHSGLLFPSCDWGAMREAVVSVVRDHALRRKLSEGATEAVARYGHDSATEGVVRALTSLNLVTTSAPAIRPPRDVAP